MTPICEFLRENGCFVAHEMTFHTANLDPETGCFDNQPVTVPRLTRITRFLEEQRGKVLAEVEIKANGISTRVYRWLNRKEWTSSIENPSRASRTKEVSMLDLDFTDARTKAA